MRRWWITYDEHAQRELDELDELGWRYEVNQAAYENGRLVLNLNYPHEGGTIPLVAYYPPTYPYFMPIVSAPSLNYEHHQNPFNQHLCLLEQAGNDWRPGRDTLAGLLQRMFPEIALSNSDDPAQRESAKQEIIAEPLSAFLPTVRPGAITHPSYTPTAGVESGTFVVKSPMDITSQKYQYWPHIRGTTTTIRDMQGNDIYTSPLTEQLTKVLRYTHSINGFWFLLPAKPPQTDLKELKRHILNSMPLELRSRLPMKKGARFIIAAAYQDEVSLGHMETEWIFFASELVEHTQEHVIGCNMNPLGGDIDTKESLLARTPELAPLRGKRVLLIGLGSLGSPLAMELARAGVETLELADHDVVSVGNSVRWALGWSANGEYKSHALANEIIRQHPYTTPIPYIIRIGAELTKDVEEGLTDAEILDRAIQQADLVIDATAEDRIGYYLADLCQYHERPFLWLSTTHGGWGGRIARVIPNTGQGCFHCATYHIHDNKDLIPPGDPNGNLQARGCADMTFTGAGVDASTIALQAARLAIATLCRGEENGYPDFDWNLAVISLRDKETGQALFPEMVSYPLVPHPNCHCQQS